MPKPTVTVVTKHTPNLASLMVMIYDQLFGGSANNALVSGGFDL